LPQGPALGYRITKRAIDVTVAIGVLVVLSPVLLVIAAAVAVALGRPVLFRQERPGLRGRPFTLYKFRTMSSATDANGALLPDAERLTRFGRFLRSSSLDELPELVNVLRGEMSLVGPRPLLMQYLDRYSAEQMRRHDVRPGITGWVQVNGRNDQSWERKFELDVWYVDHASLRLDFQIIAKTLSSIVRREGIALEGHATTVEFMGTPVTGDETVTLPADGTGKP
jgi:sugar transferase EpsL